MKKLLDANPRFDQPRFERNPDDVPEMKEMRILPGKMNPADVDVYATDEAYWRLFWWKPRGKDSSESAASPIESR